MMVPALIRGVASTISSPRLLIWLWLLNLLAALPAAVWMTHSIRSSVGASLVHENLRQGFDLEWFGEYEGEARGLEESFSPGVLGGGALLENLEGWASGKMFVADPGLVTLGCLYLLLWVLMLGGILDRFARPPVRLQLGEFLRAGAGYFFRLLRLALMAGVLYLVIYLLSRRLFPWIEHMTRDLTSEREILLLNLAGAAVVIFLLALVNLLFDYAKIVTVLEQRRSVLLALWRALRFVLSQPVRAAAIYALFSLLSLGAVAIYLLIAPGPGQASIWGMALVFLTGQAALIVRLALRLARLASELELYQGFHRRSSRSL